MDAKCYFQRYDTPEARTAVHRNLVPARVRSPGFLHACRHQVVACAIRLTGSLARVLIVDTYDARRP